MARPAAAQRRLGPRSGPALSIPEFAGLPAPVGRTGRRGVGTRARALPRPVRQLQRHPGWAPARLERVGGVVPARLIPEPTLRLLMTADAVGGVWTYALDLARGLGRHGVETTLAVLGPLPSPEQRVDAESVPGLHLVPTGLPLDWTAAEPRRIAQAGAAI